MSLKAKLEAVIYAAEEPVTMAQLALLFTADALEYKAEQDAAAAKGAESALNAPESSTTGDEIDYSALVENEEAPATEAPAEPIAETSEEAPVSENPEQTAAPSTESERQEEHPEQESADQVVDEAAAEANLKREARLRDREVRAILRGLLDELIAEYASDDRGVEIREIAGGFRMATKPECHDVVRAFVKGLKPALKLSLPALETLAVVAYKQPVTAPEVNEIRGVDSSGVFGSLLARKLIATAGRKQVIGRPILYKTTKEFLMRFGLKDLSELPSMEEFEKMAALELEETEAAERQPEQNLSPELDEEASEEEEVPAEPPAPAGEPAETENLSHD